MHMKQITDIFQNHNFGIGGNKLTSKWHETKGTELKRTEAIIEDVIQEINRLSRRSRPLRRAQKYKPHSGRSDLGLATRANNGHPSESGIH